MPSTRTNVNNQSGIEPFWENETQRKRTDRWYIVLLLVIFAFWFSLVVTAMVISFTKTGNIEGDPNSYDHTKSVLPQYFSEVIYQNTVGVFEIIKALSKALFELSPTTVSIGIILVFPCISVLLRLVRLYSRKWSMISLFGIAGYLSMLFIVNVMTFLLDTEEIIKSFSDWIWVHREQFGRHTSHGNKTTGDDYAVSIIRNYHIIELNQTTSENLTIEMGNRMAVVVLNYITIFYGSLVLIFMQKKIFPLFSKFDKIFKYIFRICFFFYRVVFIVMIMFGLQLLVLFLSSKTFLSLQWNDILNYSVLLSGLYLNNVMLYYMVMVIAQLTATWNWATDEARIRSRIIRQSMVCVARYHMGTIAFNATVILPVVGALVVLIRKKIKSAGQFGVFDILFVIYLIPNIMEYSIVSTALKGECFTEATHTTYLTYMTNSNLFLSFTFAFRMTIFLITLIITQISGLLFLFTRLFQIDPVVLCLLAYNFYGLILQPYIILLNSIEKANLFCVMESNSRKSDETVIQNGIAIIELRAP